MPLIENRFNLVDEPWIPVAGHGLVSLADIFSKPELPSLGGNPIQKIALLKLLLAIAQSAYTPKDDEDWEQLGVYGMSGKCLQYLKDKKDLFWLYGEKPFLQMPSIQMLIEDRKKKELESSKTKAKIIESEERSKPKIIGSAEIPDLPSENDTIRTQNQYAVDLSDAKKAVFLITLMNFSLAGKHTEKDLLPLSEGYLGKSVSAKSGPSLGMPFGYLHSFLMGEKNLETLWINLLTFAQITEYKLWTSKLGIAPWEKMPLGEDCEVANNLKNSYMGCLVAICRFALLKDDGIYYLEGIQYPNHKNGWKEPSIAVKGESTPLWVNPNKRPWRELTALLSFFSAQSNDGFVCQQIVWTLERVRKLSEFSIWSGGLRVRYSSGGQSVKQDDDFVESNIYLNEKLLGAIWFANLKIEMEELENISEGLKRSVKGFFKSQGKNDGKLIADQAVNLFWQLCERKFQNLVDSCAEKDSDEELRKLRKIFSEFVNKAYDTYCPKDTARQLDAWAANKPNLAKYLTKKGEDKG